MRVFKGKIDTLFKLCFDCLRRDNSLSARSLNTLRECWPRSCSNNSRCLNCCIKDSKNHIWIQVVFEKMSDYGKFGRLRWRHNKRIYQWGSPLVPNRNLASRHAPWSEIPQLAPPPRPSKKPKYQVFKGSIFDALSVEKYPCTNIFAFSCSYSETFNLPK